MIKLYARVLTRSDTKANWTAKNPVLGEDERVFEIQPDGTRKEKVGDGTTRYNLLPYYTVQGTSTGGNTGGTTAQAVLERGVHSDVTVGGIDAGRDLPLGMTFTEFTEALLSKVFYPLFYAPSFSLGHAEGSSIEVGTVLTVDLVFNFNRGLIQATWPGGADLPYTGTAYGYRFYNRDNSGIQLVMDPNFQVPDYQVREGNNNNFTADVIINAGQQPKDSKGNNYSSAYPGGTSPKQTTGFHGYLATWYGPVDAVPAGAAAVRNLPGKQPNSAGNGFVLNTGSTQTKLLIITAPGLSLASVVDLDALNSVITSEYEYQATIAVNDAGGNAVPGFKVYLKTMGVAYTSNHRHQITLG